MYLIKGAFKNISRAKGRNILIGIIVLIIAAASCVAISIRQSAKTIESQSIDSLTVTASIDVDRESIMQNAQKNSKDFREEMQKYSDLSLSQMKKYAKSTYVSDFLYTISSSVAKTDDFESVDTSAKTTESPATQAPDNGPGGMQGNAEGPMLNGMGTQGDFTITGYSSYTAMTDFTSGTSKIIKGKIFSEKKNNKECIINEQLATLNSIKVGKYITVSNPNDDTKTYKLKVVGIYSTTASSDSNMMRFSTSTDPANQIYTNYNVLNTVIKKSEKNATTGTDSSGNKTTTALRTRVSGTYTIKNPTDFNSFKTDVKNMGLSKYYTVNSADADNYEASLTPLKNTNQFALVFLLLVLGIGGVILIVLNIFNIRERKYEVGVLTAIGMKKGKVALQYICEIFIVTLLAVIIGTGVGASLSVPVSNSLLQSQVESQQKSNTQQSQNFGRGGNSMMQGGPGQMGKNTQTVNYIDKINASTDLYVLLQLMGICVLLTIISSLAAVLFILRYEPLKILSNRA